MAIVVLGLWHLCACQGDLDEREDRLDLDIDELTAAYALHQRLNDLLHHVPHLFTKLFRIDQCDFD